jgi:hypothetical protein
VAKPFKNIFLFFILMFQNYKKKNILKQKSKPVKNIMPNQQLIG